jgi:phage pi2 protein 07
MDSKRKEQLSIMNETSKFLLRLVVGLIKFFGVLSLIGFIFTIFIIQNDISNKATDTKSETAPVDLESEKNFISKCVIATVMRRSPSIMETMKVGNVIFVNYKRADETSWRFKCKLEDGLATWGNADGRWRTEDHISYVSDGSTITVTERHNDGSKTVKRFQK